MYGRGLCVGLFMQLYHSSLSLGFKICQKRILVIWNNEDDQIVYIYTRCF